MKKRWWLVLVAVVVVMVTAGTVLAATEKIHSFAAKQGGGDGVTIFADAFDVIENDLLLFGEGADLIGFDAGEAHIAFRQSVLDADTEMIHFQEWDTADNTDDTLTVRADTVFISSNGAGDVIITLGN